MQIKGPGKCSGGGGGDYVCLKATFELVKDCVQ